MKTLFAFNNHGFMWENGWLFQRRRIVDGIEYVPVCRTTKTRAREIAREMAKPGEIAGHLNITTGRFTWK